MATAGPSGGASPRPDKAEGKEKVKDKKEKKPPIKTAELFTRLRQLYDEHKIPPEQLEIIQRIGEGGFASVDLCWYTPPGGERIQVAVKRVKPGALKLATQLKLFTNESDIMCRLKHHCIVGLIGLGATDASTNELLRDTFYLVEELLSGGSLRRIVLHQMIHHPLQLYRVQDAVRWCRQMAEALDYIHTMNPVVVHRDLKPDNILLTCDDAYVADIKLADFGLSVMIPNKHLQAEGKAHTDSARNAAKEQKWSKSMAPTSAAGIVGASAMLHMMEGPAGTEVAGYDALAPPSGAVDYYGAPTSARLRSGVVPPHSRTVGGPSSRTGPTSKVTSRGGILTSLRNLGKGSQKQLEAPSGVMFDLTSMTGSLLYMAPEVFRGENYNYKADVFSFGVVMYELLHQRLIMATLIAQQMEDRNVFENEIMEFTKSVSKGYRPPMDTFLPDYVAQLISSCWAQNPTDRPPMKQVVEVLRKFQASPELAAIDKSRQPGCCVVS